MHAPFSERGDFHPCWYGIFFWNPLWGNSLTGPMGRSLDSSAIFCIHGAHGAELFEMSWVQSIVLLFSYLAWALYGVGLVVSVFEVGIEYQTGRANVKMPRFMP